MPYSCSKAWSNYCPSCVSGRIEIGNLYLCSWAVGQREGAERPIEKCGDLSWVDKFYLGFFSFFFYFNLLLPCLNLLWVLWVEVKVWEIMKKHLRSPKLKYTLEMALWTPRLFQRAWSGGKAFELELSVNSLVTKKLCSFLSPGLRPGFDGLLLWWSGRPHLPGSLLLCHSPHVQFHCVQCPTHLAAKEV